MSGILDKVVSQTYLYLGINMPVKPLYLYNLILLTNKTHPPL